MTRLLLASARTWASAGCMRPQPETATRWALSQGVASRTAPTLAARTRVLPTFLRLRRGRGGRRRGVPPVPQEVHHQQWHQDRHCCACGHPVGTAVWSHVQQAESAPWSGHVPRRPPLSLIRPVPSCAGTTAILSDGRHPRRAVPSRMTAEPWTYTNGASHSLMRNGQLYGLERRRGKVSSHRNGIVY